MTRRIEHRMRSEHAADEVYATLVDRGFLEARLRELGGPGAAVLELSADAERAAYRLRLGIPEQNLPPLVRPLVPGDLTVERAESWVRVSPGHYSGSVAAGVRGAPGWIRGTLRLDDLDDVDDVDGGSELVVDGATKMTVPLLGGRLEGLVAENLQWLLDNEAAFTLRWLAR